VTMIEDRAPWRNLTDLKLGNNQWSCDCLIAWMDSLKKIDKENVTCYSPAQFAGKNLFETESQMFCSSNHAKTAVLLGIAIPIIIICLLLIGYYVRQIIQNRHKQERERHAFKYRSVYGDTVESTSKTSILT